MTMTATQISGRVNRLAAASTGAAVRRVSVRAVALAIAALLTAPLATAGNTVGSSGAARAASVRIPHALVSVELRTLDRINAVRAQHGLRRLSLDGALSHAATAHGQQMLSDGYFSHATAVGVDFSRRIAYYYPAGNARLYGVGENILYTEGAVDAFGIVSRWMESPGHRENLLSPSWRQLGISVLTVGSAHGVFRGGPATVVTVDFGVRA